MILLALLFSTAAFALLALSMSKHYRQVFQGAPSQRLSATLRVLGGCVLVAGLSLCVLYSGPARGVVLWVGLLTVAALGVSLGLSFQPNIRPGRAVPRRAVVNNRARHPGRHGDRHSSH
ncbi:MAG: DUF3325 domain-containing protein [Aquisalimonadaceae bacterium]